MSFLESLKLLYKQGRLQSLEKKIRKYPMRRERAAVRQLKRIRKYDALRAELAGQPERAQTIKAGGLKLTQGKEAR